MTKADNRPSNFEETGHETKYPEHLEGVLVDE